jgi:catechol 2,3-dioxygenase-like lactoylglutathione lyase family enzyme
MIFEQIHLDTGPLESMREFYENTLGFPLLETGPNHFTLQAGHTTLTFHRVESRPYYHFAFNIPSFSIRQALDWLRARVEILDFRGADIVDFSAWNAEAVYFYDPAGNILEFIARKNLNVGMDGDFGIDKVLSVSELGWSSHDIRGFRRQVLSGIGTQEYDGEDPKFFAIGKETGLFIMVNPEIKDWIPRADPAVVVPFRCRVRTDHVYEMEFDGRELKIERVG